MTGWRSSKLDFDEAINEAVHPGLTLFAKEVRIAIAEAKARRCEAMLLQPGQRKRPEPKTDAGRARQALGLSQAQFAKLLGAPVKTLQNWEQGRTRPQGAVATLIKVALRAPDVLRQVSEAE